MLHPAIESAKQDAEDAAQGVLLGLKRKLTFESNEEVEN